MPVSDKAHINHLAGVATALTIERNQARRELRSLWEKMERMEREQLYGIATDAYCAYMNRYENSPPESPYYQAHDEPNRSAVMAAVDAVVEALGDE